MNNKKTKEHTFLMMYLILLIAGCSSDTTDCQIPEIEVKTITSRGVFPITNFYKNKSYTAKIIQNPDYNNLTISDADWPAEDWFKLILIDETGKNIVDHSFRSSYGQFKIDFIDLNGDGVKEAVLIFMQGRGTSAVKKTLIVYEVTENSLHQLYSTEYSGYYGSGVQWRYERHYRDTNNDGIIDLELLLDHDAVGQTHLESPELIPKEIRKVFRGAN